MLQLNLLKEIQADDKFCSKNCYSKFYENDLILSIIQEGKYLAIWDPNDNSCKGFIRGSHQQPLTAFALSPYLQMLLCTCSSDRVIVWPTHNLEESGTIVALDMGTVDFCAFSWDNQWLAICSYQQIMIIQLKFLSEGCYQLESVKEQELIETNVHENNLCDFSPTTPNLMIYLDDANSFKIRDVLQGQLLYRSFTLISHSITWIRFSQEPFNRILICTNRSIVQVYNFNGKNLKPRLIAKIDESSRTFINKEINTQEKDPSGQCGCLLFGAYLLDSLEDSAIVKPQDIYQEIVKPGPLLVIYSNLGISIYDCNSWNLLTFFSFEALNIEKELLTFLTCIDFVTISKYQMKFLLKSSFFSKFVYIITVEIKEEKIETKISSLSPSPLCVSQLKSQPVERSVSEEHRSCIVPTFLNPSRVRSSGYGSHQTSTRMFIPNTSLTKKRSNINNNKKGRSNSNNNKKNNSSSNSGSSQWSQKTRTIKCNLKSPEIAKYLNDVGPPKRIVKKNVLPSSRGSQIRIAHSGDGTLLAYGSTQKIIHLLNAKDLTEMKSNDILIGHDEQIKSLHFSLSGKYLASNSEKIIKIWDIKSKKCVLNVDPQLKKNIQQRLVKSCLSARRPKLTSIQNVQFFYKDQFLLYTCDSDIHLDLLLMEPNDNTQPWDGPRFRAVSKFPIETQKITSFSALNYLYSNIILCGCSNKSIQVLDINQEKVCLTLDDVHSRVPHLIRYMAWSPNPFDHPPPLYDIFLTTAINDGVKLWDLRSASCVLKYSSHCNKMFSTFFDVSPCARYLAVGGEDNSLYLYDTRNNVEWLHRWSGLGSPILDVSYNTTNALVAAATLNGTLLLFGP